MSGIQHFVAPKTGVPFELIIPLPKPRYERNIIARDEFGRILHSRPPEPLV